MTQFNYKDFNAWFFEGEEYSMRNERFTESLKAFTTDASMEASMILWLQSAFEAGRQSND